MMVTIADQVVSGTRERKKLRRVAHEATLAKYAAKPEPMPAPEPPVVVIPPMRGRGWRRERGLTRMEADDDMD
jgi:hypothetical protein